MQKSYYISRRKPGRGNPTGFKKRPFSRGPKHFGKGTRGAKRAKGPAIDPGRFVNKANGAAPIQEYIPQHTFGDFALAQELKAAIQKKGYKTPTAIQDKAIPLVIEGKDVVGVADTGTGKTAAFLVPLVDKVVRNRKERIIIVTPTRELALQISQELSSFSFGMRIYAAVCIGGSSMGFQISQLRCNPNFVIGTPGRLKDHVDKKRLRLEEFGTIVLDEADRMLDMGFLPTIKLFLSKIPATRQTLLFSATIPAAIESLIRTFVPNPATVSVKLRDTSANVDQDVIRVQGKEEKFEKLCSLLSNQNEFSKVLVFGQTKHGVRKLSDALTKRGFKSVAIHGDKTQNDRKKALDMFHRNHVQVLVATDVAARGLDIANVTHVINFDTPATYEDYIHRIGRTGRANQKGIALTFV